MATVVLVIHIMIAAALVGAVLLQKSEGGALGIGGGGGGGFLTGRGTANLLTRVTAGLAAAFFATSIILATIASRSAPTGSVFDAAKPSQAPAAGAPATPGATLGADAAKPAESRGGVLDKLQSPDTVRAPVEVPKSQ